MNPSLITPVSLLESKSWFKIATQLIADTPDIDHLHVNLNSMAIRTSP
jgi:hypothetical protein